MSCMLYKRTQDESQTQHESTGRGRRKGAQEGGTGRRHRKDTGKKAQERTLETEIERQGVWDKEKKKEWKQDEN